MIAEVDVPQVVSILGVAVAIGLMLRIVVSSSNNSAAVGASAQASIIQDLQAESKKWRELAEAEKQECIQTRALLEIEIKVLKDKNLQLKNQNYLLRALLISRGVTEAELFALGVHKHE